MATNSKLDELNKLGLQYFDNWKDYAAATANASPGQVIGGINKKGKLVFYQGGIGEINIKQAKVELTSLKNASAPSQAPSGNIAGSVTSGKKFDPKTFRVGARIDPGQPGLNARAQAAAATGVQQNIVDPQQVNPSTKTINDALKNPKSKSTKKDTTLKTGKRTSASIDRSAAIVKLANNPDAEQEMMDIISQSVGMRKGKSSYSKMVKSAKGTLGKPDPGPKSKQGYIDAVTNRDFFIEEGRVNRRSLLRARIAEENPNISKTKLRRLVGKEMSTFSDEALFNIGEEINRDIMQKYYVDTAVYEESERLARMTQEQRLQAFQGQRSRNVRGKRVPINNISDRQVLNLSEKYLKQYERLELGDSRVVRNLAKAGEKLRGGIAMGDISYHPGYSAIESSLDEAYKRRMANKAAGVASAAADDSAMVAAQISSALSSAGNMLEDSAQAITKVTNKKAISARTLEKIISSHTLSAGLAAGGAALLYGLNKKRGEQQIG